MIVVDDIALIKRSKRLRLDDMSLYFDLVNIKDERIPNLEKILEYTNNERNNDFKTIALIDSLVHDKTYCNYAILHNGISDKSMTYIINNYSIYNIVFYIDSSYAQP